MMSSETIFLVEKSMGLFWVFIQQVCFCGVGYVYGDLVHEAFGRRAFFLRQSLVFLALCLLCFEKELGISCLSGALAIGERNFYPWTIRILLCSAMILFDTLLLLYTFRIYRVCTRGREAIRPTLPVDLCLVAGVSFLCVAYIRQSIDTALLHDLSMWDYTWLGRAFIQLSNFFYVPLEIAGAILLYFFRKTVRRSLNVPHAGEISNV